MENRINKGIWSGNLRERSNLEGLRVKRRMCLWKLVGSMKRVDQAEDCVM